MYRAEEVARQHLLCGHIHQELISRLNVAAQRRSLRCSLSFTTQLYAGYYRARLAYSSYADGRRPPRYRLADTRFQPDNASGYHVHAFILHGLTARRACKKRAC